MKIVKSFWIIIIFGNIILTSCVSSKKYKATVNSRVEWEQKYHLLEADYKKLDEDRRRLQASTSEELLKKQQELKDRESELLDRGRKIQELKAAMNEQRNALANLKQEVCSALKCFSPDELKVEVRDGKLYVSMSDKLLFPSGSEQVNERGKEAIEMLAAVLKNSDLELMVEGHTDPVPISTSRNKDNWDLSVHRATTVIRIFTENGIAPERLIASGRGEFHPVTENNSHEGRQQNRRTEIVLAPKLDNLWKLTEEEEGHARMEK